MRLCSKTLFQNLAVDICKNKYMKKGYRTEDRRERSTLFLQSDGTFIKALEEIAMIFAMKRQGKRCYLQILGPQASHEVSLAIATHLTHCLSPSLCNRMACKRTKGSSFAQKNVYRVCKLVADFQWAR